MNRPNPVVHFEMPFVDRKRMADFYGHAFGWRTQMLGEEMGNYVLAETTESENNCPTQSGAINGGFYPKSADLPDQHPGVVIAVDDLAASMDAVARAGGSVVGVPMEIPGVGRFVSFRDTEGNRAGMMQYSSEDCTAGEESAG